MHNTFGSNKTEHFMQYKTLTLVLYKCGVKNVLLFTVWCHKRKKRKLGFHYPI